MTMTLDITLAEFDGQMQEDYKDSIAEASVSSDSVQIVSITEVQTRRRLLSSGIDVVKTRITGIKTVMEELVLEHENCSAIFRRK